MGIVEGDATYRAALLSSAGLLSGSFDACLAAAGGESRAHAYTEAVALRMQAWYHGQRQVQAFLPKDLAAPASDAFVEAVTFFLKVWLCHAAPDLSVAAERKANRYRPDVSVFRDGKLLAVVECKTNLGRSRQQWKEDFSQRELELGSLPSAPKVFLLVLTARNWHGFGGDPRNGDQLFTLLSKWPSDLPLGESPLGAVIDPIEPLFQTIAAL